MRCKSDVAHLQTHYSEERFSGTVGTNRLQEMTHSHHVELPQLSE